MTKIIFWNVEHLSPQALDIADKAADAAKRAAKRAKTHAAVHASDEPTRPTTRLFVKDHRNTGTRYERAEARAFQSLDRAQNKAERLRRKLLLSEDLARSAQHTFFCEVLVDHPDARSPLLGGAAAGGGTLCYAHYKGGVSTNFTHCPISDNWYVGAPFPGLTRVPRGVVINGASGAAKGKPVRFCYWHAPSGNSGKIVAKMANGLHAGGQPFVLFGDLNAEPSDFEVWLAPGVTILKPPGPTRISGRKLDYAVTNVASYFHPCRPLYSGHENYKIKEQTGSDHMVMILQLK